jgi:hypothetical protein
MMWTLGFGLGALVCTAAVWLAHPVFREKLVAGGRLKDRNLTWQSRERLALTVLTAVATGCAAAAAIYVRSLLAGGAPVPAVASSQERQVDFQPPIVSPSTREEATEEAEQEEGIDTVDTGAEMGVYEDEEPDTGEEGRTVEETGSGQGAGAAGARAEETARREESGRELRSEDAPLDTFASLVEVRQESGGEALDASPPRRVLTRRTFHMTLKGSVGGKYPMVMELKSAKRELSGTYHGEGKKVERRIKGELDRNGVCVVRGYAKGDSLVAEFTGFFDNRRFVGTYKDAETGVTMPFELAAERETPPIRSFLGTEK